MSEQRTKLEPAEATMKEGAKKPALKSATLQLGTAKPLEIVPSAETDGPASSEERQQTISKESHQRFMNRELSWLAFNTRVLEEADNVNHPILERLRFLSISASNLDEFYMVRVAGLRGQVNAGIATPSQDGLSPIEQLRQINQKAGELISAQQRCWETLNYLLREHGIAVLDGSELSDADSA